MITMNDLKDILYKQLYTIAEVSSEPSRPKYYAPQWFFDEFGYLIPSGFERVVLPDRFECERV